MIDPGLADRVAERCIRDALKFWGIADLWRVSYRFDLLDNPECLGECWVSERYYTAKMTLVLARMDSPLQLWQVTAHEVCHIVPSEYRVFHYAVPTDETTAAVWTVADERTVSLLERVLLRERPYPGDDAFKEAA